MLRGMRGTSEHAGLSFSPATIRQPAAGAERVEREPGWWVGPVKVQTSGRLVAYARE